MSELPAGWVVTPLGKLLHAIEAGQNVKCEERAPQGNEAGLVKISAVTWGRFDEEASKTLPLDTTVNERNRIRPGDLLISRANTIELVGASVIVGPIGKRLYLSDKVLRLIVDEAAKRWINYALKAPQLRQAIQAASTGNQLSMRNIPQDKLRALNIPLAPAAEQTRIADQLDILLARIQSCNDRLDAIPALLKRFRHAVLGAATSGALTVDWRGQDELTEWVSATVGDVLDGKPRNGYSPKAVDYETPVRSLTLSATTSGRFLSHHTKFIDEGISAESHLWLEPGDILIQRANTLEYVGVSAIYDGPRNTFIYPDLMMKCRPNSRIQGRFLFYVLSAESTRKYFRENATGTAGNMPKINQQTVMSTPIALPPIDEQAEIVRRVERLLSIADRMEQRRTAATKHVQRLTSLTLAKAFRGELVQQDPNDEPASVLLQRLTKAPTAVVKVPRGGPQSKQANQAIQFPIGHSDGAVLPAGTWAAGE